MARKSIWLTTLTLSVFLFIGTLGYSQPMGKHDKGLSMKSIDRHNEMQRPPKAIQPPRGREQQGKRRPPMDPKVKEARNAIMVTAEAHRKLSEIFKKQGMIDEAAAQLKSIIDLADCTAAKSLSKKGEKATFSRKVLPVYIQLARMYMKNNRLADAEKIINDGVKKYEKEQPHMASKLILTLGEMYTKKGEIKKAEATYKRVIELNAKALK